MQKNKEAKNIKGTEPAEKPKKQPMSMLNRILLCILGIALLVFVIYILYYVFHYVLYNHYRDFVTDYAYESGSTYAAAADTDPKVAGFELVCENDTLKLYTKPATAEVAVFDKRSGVVTYTNPVDTDDDTVANDTNKNYMRSQFVLDYYDSDANSGRYNSFADCVSKGQFGLESIGNGVRYIYEVGDLGTLNNGNEAIHFTIPIEYRLENDHLNVSVPVKGIGEFGGGQLYRIQLLRFMGAPSSNEEGYMVVPNGSGSIINFNNGKMSGGMYSQYVYDMDPLSANLVTMENLETSRLAMFGICREKSSVLGSIEEGATTAVIQAGTSGLDTSYNYVCPAFVLRIADNLRMFGDATQDVYVVEQDMYDVNITVQYTFLNEDYSGYSGLARYFREKLIADGKLKEYDPGETDIPLYYDIIAALKEDAHFLGVQYLNTFAVTTFDQAKEINQTLKNGGVDNQIVNLQGAFNGGYYHDAADKIRLVGALGGKGKLTELNNLVDENGGSLYLDAAFQQVSFADEHFNYDVESARYYGAGYVASFGLVNPTTLRNTSGLGYMENRYNLISPKYLPRYTEKFASAIKGYDVEGISLRDLGSVLVSDKKRTAPITRDEARQVVEAQLDLLSQTGKKILTNQANDYAFIYSDAILNAPMTGNDVTLVDANIPLYEMILHGYIPYSSELLNFENADDMQKTILKLIEYGASPHYQFTWTEASRMKLTALNRYYNTTFATWKDSVLDTYNKVNGALKGLNGDTIVSHEVIGEEGLQRRIEYSGGTVIYVNYSDEPATIDGVSVDPVSYVRV